jgi:hypothetical protein
MSKYNIRYYLANDKRLDKDKEFSSTSELKSYYDNIGAILISVVKTEYENSSKDIAMIDKRAFSTNIVADKYQRVSKIRVIGIKPNINIDSFESAIKNTFRLNGKKIEKIVNPKYG